MKSINFSEEVELKMVVFFSDLLGKDREERMYVMRQNQAGFVESFLTVMHPWEKILVWNVCLQTILFCQGMPGCLALMTSTSEELQL